MNTVNVNLGTFKARIFVFIDFKERGAFEKKKRVGLTKFEKSTVRCK